MENADFETGELDEFWERIPGGDRKPESFVRPLDIVTRLRKFPRKLRKRIFEDLSVMREPGGDSESDLRYVMAKIPNSKLRVAVVQKPSAHWSDICRIDGLTDDSGQPDTYYRWQMGMTEGLGYYYFDGEKVTSIEEVGRKVTEKKVKFYFFGDEHKEEPPHFTALVDSAGEEYYAVFLHEPTSLHQIFASLHEIGHIVGRERSGDNYEKRLDESGYVPVEQRLIEAANKKLVRILDQFLPRDEQRTKVRDLSARLERHKAREFLRDHEMVIELDAWSAGLWLLGEVGFAELFKDNPDFAEYMVSCVKSRLPEVLKKKQG